MKFMRFIYNIITVLTYVPYRYYVFILLAVTMSYWTAEEHLGLSVLWMCCMILNAIFITSHIIVGIDNVVKDERARIDNLEKDIPKDKSSSAKQVANFIIDATKKKEDKDQ